MRGTERGSSTQTSYYRSKCPYFQERLLRHKKYLFLRWDHSWHERRRRKRRKKNGPMHFEQLPRPNVERIHGISGFYKGQENYSWALREALAWGYTGKKKESTTEVITTHECGWFLLEKPTTPRHICCIYACMLPLLNRWLHQLVFWPSCIRIHTWC